MGPSVLMKSDESSEKFLLTLSSPAVFVCFCVGEQERECVLPFFLISTPFQTRMPFLENKYLPRGNLGQVMLTFSRRIYTYFLRLLKPQWKFC